MLQTAKHFRSKTFCDKVTYENGKKIEQSSNSSSKTLEPNTINGNQRKSWFPSVKNFSENRTPLLFDSIINQHQNIKNGKIEYNIEKYDENCIEESKIEKIVCLVEDEKKMFIYMFLCFITVSLVHFLCLMYPLLKVRLKYKYSSIRQSSHLLIYGADNKIYIVSAYEVNLPNLRNCNILNYTKNPVTVNQTKMFEFKLHKYVYSPLSKSFFAVQFNLNTSFDIIIRKMGLGLTEQEVSYQKTLYSYKYPNVNEAESLMKILSIELRNPFYLIQICCIFFWINFNYANFAVILLMITIGTLMLTSFEIKQNLQVVHNISKYSCEVAVIRIIKGVKQQIKINSDDLVPGDIFELPNEETLIMPCDALLISGTSIMDESFLTGESVPIFKSHIPNTKEHLNIKADQGFILFSGSRILQTRNKAQALVIGTGFDTEKGNLVRAILYKENYSLEQDNREIWQIIYFILGFGLIGFICAIHSMVVMNFTFGSIVYKIIDHLSIVSSPALPACIAIGVSICLLRIKRKGINCIDRTKINIVGKVNVICFDKTGTLTEDHLDLFGFRPISYSKGNFIFSSFTDDISDILTDTYAFYKDQYCKGNSIITVNPLKSSHEQRLKLLKMFYIEALACCNSITQNKDQLIGDPIDVEMFKATNWKVEETFGSNQLTLAKFRPDDETYYSVQSLANNLGQKDPKYEIALIRRFDYVSKLQRMSVVVKNTNEDFYKVYCKGSPEKIREMCRVETIPSNFNRILSQYTNQGLRVLALGFKMLKMDFTQSQKISRESVEHELIFLGFFIVANKLRPKTKRTISTLKDSGIKTIMATGDNVFTATSVSKECHIIPEDLLIYQLDVISQKDSLGYELTCKELIVEPVEDDQQDDSYSFSDESEGIRINMKRQVSKLTDNITVESVDEDDLESDGYEENDIHLIIKNKPKTELKSLKINNVKIKSNSCFVITGSAFQILYNLSLKVYDDYSNEEYKIYNELFSMLLNKTLVFARMLPEQKALLIQCFKETNNIIAMCGDGANDIGALRTANVGISLGLDDTAISAHFITKSPNIKCILRIICEGKACLSNTIECYKYMILLSFIEFLASCFLLHF